MPEIMLKGWKEIAKFYQVSVRTAQRRRKEMCERGIIFVRYEGRPPKKYICAWQSMLMAFVVERGKL